MIEDFEETDVDTFKGALTELDKEYNDPEETVQYLLEAIRKLTQIHYKSDEDFVSKLADMSTLLKRLVKVQPEARMFLDTMVKPWMDFIPEPVFHKVQRLLGKNKASLKFDTVFEIAKEFADSYKHTKGLIASRNKAQRSHRNVHQASVSDSPEVESPQMSEEDCLEAHYARLRPKPACCFCGDETHHATACPKDLQRDFKKDVINSQRRCLLCLETGHRSYECPLLKMEVTLPFACDCSSHPPHALITCGLNNPIKTK